jgi:hypothetical protein
VLGATIGLAALTRSEALLLVVLLAAPAVWPKERRVANLALVCAAVVAICLPWCVRNSLEFDQPTLLTTGDGSVLAGANLDSTYHGRLLGAWDFDGLYRTEAGRHPSRNEAVQSDRWRREGLAYMGDHLGRLPVVLAARVLRTWDAYPISPAAHASFASGYYKHVQALEYLVLPMLLAVIGLAVAGAVGQRRRDGLLWPFLAPIVLVMLVTLAGYGDPRFRHGADVALAILAGAGLSFAWEARRRASRTPTAPGPPPDPC